MSEIHYCIERIIRIVTKYEDAWNEWRDSEIRHYFWDVRMRLQYAMPKMPITSYSEHFDIVTKFLLGGIDSFEILPKKLSMPPNTKQDDAIIQKDRHAICNLFLNIINGLNIVRKDSEFEKSVSEEDFDNIALRIKIMDVYDA